MDEPCPYVSRGGLKLAAALDAFALDPTGWTCVDLGCNVGGFSDCLLQQGARHIIAVDTGYGALAWKLRNDPRVTVAERTNAMHVEIEPLRSVSGASDIDLVVIDLGWTPQRHAIPAAMRWGPRWIVTLIKPHYELPESERKKTGRKSGRVVLDESTSQAVTDRVLTELPGCGVEVVGCIRSPILGGAGKGHSGNAEYLACLRPLAVSG